ETAAGNRENTHSLRTRETACAIGSGIGGIMSPNPPWPRCNQSERVPLLAAGSLPAEELREMRAHIDSCPECREEFDALRRVTAAFAYWPTDVLRPDRSL